MASYRIEWKRSAAKEIKRLPGDVISRILQAVDGLASDPLSTGCDQTSGNRSYLSTSCRGCYQILYLVEDAVLRIEIVRVRHGATSTADLIRLTNLYKARSTWLDNVHRKLDAAVFAAYGWPVDLGGEQILERLLALNLARAGE